MTESWAAVEPVCQAGFFPAGGRGTRGPFTLHVLLPLCVSREQNSRISNAADASGSACGRASNSGGSEDGGGGKRKRGQRG